MGDIIAQGIGILTAILSVVSAQMKNITAILLTELAANLLVALSYLLLGGDAGALVCLTACMQVTASFFFAKRGKQVPKTLTAAFVAIYIALSALTFQSMRDILPCICAVAFALSVAQSKAAGYRLFMTVSAVLWLVYDVTVGAWGMLLTHGLLLVSLVIAICRQDIKRIGK